MKTWPRQLLATTALGLTIGGALALWPLTRGPTAKPAVRQHARWAPPLPAAPATAAAPRRQAVDRLVDRAQEVERREVPTATGANVRRQRLLRTTEFKYPDLLVDETVAPAAAGQDERVLQRQTMVADRVLVKLRPGATESDLQRLNAARGARLDGTPLAPNLYLVQLARPGLDAVQTAVAAYAQAAATVSYAEPDYLVWPLEVPNDPHFSGYQWALANTGQLPTGQATVAAGATTAAALPMRYAPATPPAGVTGLLYDCGLGQAGEFPAGVSGNLALIRRGDLSLAQKAANAWAAGAMAAIVYNNAAGTFSGTLGTPGDWLPVVGVADTDGAALLALGTAPATVIIAGSVVGADISAPAAWDITHGSASVIVGVLDTGVDYLHPDLAANIWTNPGEIPANGVDDDGNGFVDDVHGYDFVDNDGEPLDDLFHGTHCAGTIGAVGHNGVGVAGVCWNVRLMVLRFMGASGGSMDDAIRALHYATQMGAKVTSNSWGGTGVSQALKDEIEAAGAAGALFVAGAGNGGSDSDSSPYYPAAYDCANVVAVAATDGNDQLVALSNYGLTSVDLAAPGWNILSTFPTYLTDTMRALGYPTDYGMMGGTSSAAPHVAGVCALMLAAAPAATAVQLKHQLLAQTDPLPTLAGKCVSGGRLNAAKAVRFPPAAADDRYPATEDSVLTVAAPGVLANDVDPNGDPLTASKVTDPAHGTLTLNADGSFVYTPAAGYHGADSFTYQANDGAQDGNVATVTLDVNPVNSPPTIDSPAWADPNPVTLPAGTTLHVVASDPDGDLLTYAWAKVSGAGTATFATATATDSGVTFSAAGTYILRVNVADGKGGSVSSDVTVTANAGAGVDPRADLNHDGVVNALDLQIVIANFGQTVGSPGCDARADANADNVVNALDLQIVIANFGQTVP